MNTQAGRPNRWTVLRDALSYLGGWLLIGYQALAVPPKDVNEWFLLLGGSLIGVPGIAEILQWRAKNIGMGGSDGSPPPPDSPRQGSSSSGTTSPVGEP